MQKSEKVVHMNAFCFNSNLEPCREKMVPFASADNEGPDQLFMYSNTFNTYIAKSLKKKKKKKKKKSIPAKKIE